MTFPSIPVNLIQNLTLSNAVQIALSWQQGTTYYGATIIDYTIVYDQGLGQGVFVTLAQNIIGTSYIVQQVTTGFTYQFKIAARSEFGLSLYSEVITVVAA